MESKGNTRTTDAPPHADDVETELARKVELEQETVQLPKRPIDDPLFTSTALAIIGAVAIAIVILALYWVLR